mgnify:CR=1 FL=1
MHDPEYISACPPFQSVESRSIPPFKEVVSLATEEPVCTTATNETVVAVPAEEGVVAGAAVEGIVAVTPRQTVIAIRSCLLYTSPSPRD